MVIAGGLVSQFLEFSEQVSPVIEPCQFIGNREGLQLEFQALLVVDIRNNAMPGSTTVGISLWLGNPSQPLGLAIFDDAVFTNPFA